MEGPFRISSDGIEFRIERLVAYVQSVRPAFWKRKRLQTKCDWFPMMKSLIHKNYWVVQYPNAKLNIGPVQVFDRMCFETQEEAQAELNLILKQHEWKEVNRSSP